eukprot:CAMPEP_0198279852 /NCGR_PEP_ID=MMETSP1449-20131203/68_1 /TAXON_ID=420275 /ORGANISM="Attheya septentrionalis, Strain CCMP2084" /LENGTH=249 /DNA_ID=CAMNT_0043975079 /DNA_START=137 /DNA_END=886 /DNA_ORIENTATION=-
MIRTGCASMIRMPLAQRCSVLNRTFASAAAAQNSEGHFLLILGKPGGGKGTISGKILKDFPMFRHLSTGDVLRQHVMNGTDIGLQAKEYMDSGELVPDSLMIRIVMEDTNAAMKSGDSLLLDGFPRTKEQAVALDKELDVDLVINLCVPTETIVERISDRWIHSPSGRVYSYSYKPPKVKGKDDITGEDLVQRDDDRPECVRNRLMRYDEVTSPLVDYYGAKGVLKTFHGTMSDKIYPEVNTWLDEKLQ